MQLVVQGERVLAYYADTTALPEAAIPAGAFLVPYAGAMEDLGRIGPAPLPGEPDGRHFRAPASPDLAAYAAAKRYRVEISGLTFRKARFATDREVGQAKITRAELKALASPAYTIPDFKTADGGFVALANADLVGLGEALDAHVQACFSAEAAVLKHIDADGFAGLPAAEALAAVDARFAGIGA